MPSWCLDEAQKYTPEQMKMFLTRLGFNSKFVITGDSASATLWVVVVAWRMSRRFWAVSTMWRLYHLERARRGAPCPGGSYRRGI